MPPNAKGLQSFLDYWLYGVVRTSENLGNARMFLRSVQEESIRKLLDTEELSFGKSRDPLHILRAYDQHLDRLGILDGNDAEYRGEGDGVHLAMGPSCPYRTACNWIHAEGTPLHCFRTDALGEVLRILTHRTYDGVLDDFGVPCQITFKPLHLEVDSDGN